MKKPVLVCVVLVCACHLFANDNDSSAQQLLVTAMQQANVFIQGAGPFQLDIDFVAQVQSPLQGHLTLRWESDERWWRKITMADFAEIDVRNGEMNYVARNAYFTPQRVKNMIGLIQLARNNGSLLAKKQKQQVENGLDPDCLHVEDEPSRKDFHKILHEICIDPASREILQNTWKTTPNYQIMERYSDYFDFQGHRYPRKLEYYANGSKAITATVTGLSPIKFDQAWLMPPKGAFERRVCNDMTSPVSIETPQPMYPKGAHDTMIAITVLADGSVDNIHILGATTQSIEKSVLATLKTWRYEPARCGKEPVISDLEVVVTFPLH
jgi:hypothetical protein